MGTDRAALKMQFDATTEAFLRQHLREPRRPNFPATPELCGAYARAYELAFRRAATFDVPDDPSLIGTPPEFGERPFSEAWSRGVLAGDATARAARESIRHGRDPQSVA